MWEKAQKKTIFTLCVDNYAPEITELTFPLINNYAKKIRADFHIIKERKFPDFPPVYEKFQVYQLAQEMGNDWNIYIDADAMVNPTTPDVTLYINKDTVMHNGADHNSIRWRHDRFFRRDGRFIGSCNWFAVFSDWCIEMYKPLDDLTFEEAVKNISLNTNEIGCPVMDETHLIDDYTVSRNIAKYGLKFTTFIQLQEQWKMQQGFLYHLYTIPNEEKVVKYKEILKAWRLV